MRLNHEESIIESWNQNASAWVQAIQQEEIASRILITNQVIIDTIFSKQPTTVLDVGCGEGWLVRALHDQGIKKIHGIDIVPELIKEAKKKGGGTFQVLSYQELAAGAIEEKFDLVVCNFSLLGQQSVDNVFKGIAQLLNPTGHFIIQTIHPISASNKANYKDGWRTGSWNGFNDQFTNPPPWYFRTILSWEALYTKHGFTLCECIEPIHPATQEFASIVFIGKI